MSLNSGQTSQQLLRCFKTSLLIDLTVFHQRRRFHSTTAGEILLMAGPMNLPSEGVQLVICANKPLWNAEYSPQSQVNKGGPQQSGLSALSNKRAL